MEAGEYVTVRHEVDLPLGYDIKQARQVVQSYVDEGYAVEFREIEGEFRNMEGERCQKIELLSYEGPAKAVEDLTEIGHKIYERLGGFEE